MKKFMLTPRQAAEKVGCSVPYIYSLIRHGQLSTVKSSTRPARYLIDPRILQGLVDQGLFHRATAEPSRDAKAIIEAIDRLASEIKNFTTHQKIDPKPFLGQENLY